MGVLTLDSPVANAYPTNSSQGSGRTGPPKKTKWPSPVRQDNALKLVLKTGESVDLRIVLHALQKPTLMSLHALVLQPDFVKKAAFPALSLTQVRLAENA